MCGHEDGLQQKKHIETQAGSITYNSLVPDPQYDTMNPQYWASHEAPIVNDKKVEIPETMTFAQLKNILEIQGIDTSELKEVTYIIEPRKKEDEAPLIPEPIIKNDDEVPFIPEPTMKDEEEVPLIPEPTMKDEEEVPLIPEPTMKDEEEVPLIPEPTMKEEEEEDDGYDGDDESDTLTEELLEEEEDGLIKEIFDEEEDELSEEEFKEELEEEIEVEELEEEEASSTATADPVLLNLSAKTISAPKECEEEKADIKAKKSMSFHEKKELKKQKKLEEKMKPSTPVDRERQRAEHVTSTVALIDSMCEKAKKRKQSGIPSIRKLHKDEVRAAQLYSSDKELFSEDPVTYSEINWALRARKIGPAEVDRAMLKEMPTAAAYTYYDGGSGDLLPDAEETIRQTKVLAEAIDKTELKKDTVLVRSITIDALKSLLSYNETAMAMKAAKADLEAAIESGNAKHFEEATKQFQRRMASYYDTQDLEDKESRERVLADVNKKNLVVTDLAFLSTSRKMEGTDNHSQCPVTLKILAHKGTKAVDIMDCSRFQSEEEVLLQAGTMFKVLKVECTENSAGAPNFVVYMETVDANPIGTTFIDKEFEYKRIGDRPAAMKVKRKKDQA